MIKNFTFNNRKFTFYKDPTTENKNIFTAIIGKNGTGKSRLLNSIITNILEENKIKQDADLFTNLSYEKNKSTTKNKPTQIIALSTSPFDKFPLSTKSPYADYEYLGLRELYSKNLSLSFISRIIGSLLTSINKNKEQVRIICDLLIFLGYEEIIQANLTIYPGINKIRDVISSSKNTEEIKKAAREGRLSSAMSPLNVFFIEHAIGWEKTIIILKKLITSSNRSRLDITISPAGIHNTATGNFLDEDYSILIEAGFLKLKNIELQKINHLQKLKISDASSGEQCVVMALLGIASHIKHGSLICIDEPEICLHPEWQEKYIALLMAAFKDFKNCHFIIATHSPQIVARLDDENCYVLDIESGEITDAKSVNHRSADFQLANLFKAPGYKNEYLSRELISFLTLLGSGASLSKEEITRARHFLTLKKLLDEKDPVKKLILILENSLNELNP